MFRNSPCKRIFALALLVAMCLTILSGCSPKEPTDETTTTPVKVNESYLDELREKGKLVVGVKTIVKAKDDYYNEQLPIYKEYKAAKKAAKAGK